MNFKDEGLPCLRQTQLDTDAFKLNRYQNYSEFDKEHHISTEIVRGKNAKENLRKKSPGSLFEPKHVVLSLPKARVSVNSGNFPLLRRKRNKDNVNEE